jgi:hypothetical protein
VKDPEGRLTPDEFLAHPWITGDSKKTDIGGTLKEMKAWNQKRGKQV